MVSRTSPNRAFADKRPVEYARDRVDALIRERFTSSSMSDAKWLRLLEVLVEMQPPLGGCKVKLVWDDAVREMRIPDHDSLGFDYYRSSMEGMISGSPRGFYSYKEIEWLEFPIHGDAATSLARRIAAAGEFDLEASAGGVRLYAYR